MTLSRKSLAKLQTAYDCLREVVDEFDHSFTQCLASALADGLLALPHAEYVGVEFNFPPGEYGLLASLELLEGRTISSVRLAVRPNDDPRIRHTSLKLLRPAGTRRK